MPFPRWSIVLAACLVMGLLLRWALHVTVKTVLKVRATSPTLRQRVLLRYEKIGFYPWMFAVLKTWLDPMFAELPQLLAGPQPIQNFLDVGCGFGIAGSFLLELFPRSQATGIDPSKARVTGASAAFADRGIALQGAAPDFEVPNLPDHFDAVFILDVVHFLSDAQFTHTLERIRNRLKAKQPLIIRANILPLGRGSLTWWLYRLNHLITQTPGYFRTVNATRTLISQAGFDVVHMQISGKNPEMHWFVSQLGQS